MAMVRQCDIPECDVTEDVQHFTVRWDNGSGQADLCTDHGQLITSHLSTEATPRRSSGGRRRGPGLTKVTTLEDIEKQKKQREGRKS